MNSGLKKIGYAGLLAGSIFISGCDDNNEDNIENTLIEKTEIINIESLKVGDKVNSIINQCKFIENGEKNLDSFKQVLSTCSIELQEIAKKSNDVKSVFDRGNTSYIFIENALNAIKGIEDILNNISKLPSEGQEIAKKSDYIKSVFDRGNTSNIYIENALENIENIDKIFKLINKNPILKDKLGVTRQLNEAEKEIDKIHEHDNGIKHTGDAFVQIPSWDEFLAGNCSKNSIKLILGEIEKK
ncbi:MAG: hypothetical protein Q8K30_07130 [Candidatus Gracilibacteria bacterium]|nr:hypothetical protein [Candidatus Gracilibacteria bacterium]